mmetsp:Transcript_11682/g.18516  ORF Transcript_11682/g.18516 Transcript_11682/m.18516 type:complete len:261 (-) Transcript_11682:117-899(-)
MVCFHGSSYAWLPPFPRESGRVQQYPFVGAEVCPACSHAYRPGWIQAHRKRYWKQISHWGHLSSGQRTCAGGLGVHRLRHYEIPIPLHLRQIPRDRHQSLRGLHHSLGGLRSDHHHTCHEILLRLRLHLRIYRGVRRWEVRHGHRSGCHLQILQSVCLISSRGHHQSAPNRLHLLPYPQSLLHGGTRLRRHHILRILLHHASYCCRRRGCRPLLPYPFDLHIGRRSDRHDLQAHEAHQSVGCPRARMVQLVGSYLWPSAH